MSDRPGVHRVGDATRFVVRSPDADAVWLSLFDSDDTERRLPMRRAGDCFAIDVAGVEAGQRYGYRAAGRWAPADGLWFDAAKLLVDPYAKAIDRAYRHHPRLSEPGADTAHLVPRAIVQSDQPAVPQQPPLFREGGLIYEANVRGLTMLHPDVPQHMRGTIAALAHPAIIDHLRRLRVTAIELMPIVAWIDERHLPPLGLSNAWGYNPVTPMAIDPRLAPGGVAELRDTVAALHDAGIGVLLDLVFNHSGEGDLHGPVLSLRGLDDRCYARTPMGLLINDTGTGNTLDASQPQVRDLIVETMRHFVATAGIDGFRFDLASVLARGPGFDRHAPIFAAIRDDALLADRVVIAEPWDIGPGGYQLGNFPADWLEWNDRYRDDVRRFWRGDGSAGALATRLAGSSDVFGGERTRSVSFVAAHDGFTLADTVAYVERHNHANGEGNRDGHGDNHSWNHGVEGPSEDPRVAVARAADLRALLATLFVTRGTIQLTAGDELGRTQRGNNNAYAQDNAVGWVDWSRRDGGLETFVAELAAFRDAHPAISDPRLRHDIEWRTLAGGPMTPADWEAKDCPGFAMVLDGGAVTVTVDRAARRVTMQGASGMESGDTRAGSPSPRT